MSTLQPRPAGAGYRHIVTIQSHILQTQAQHPEASGALSWVLSGRLTEFSIHHGPALQYVTADVLEPSTTPVRTARARNHMVVSNGTSWVVSFRGPWAPTWTDTPVGGRPTTLESGRKVVS
mgnify:CR=1 FL=1